jgi:hypothetical protein
MLGTVRSTEIPGLAGCSWPTLIGGLQHFWGSGLGGSFSSAASRHRVTGEPDRRNRVAPRPFRSISARSWIARRDRLSSGPGLIVARFSTPEDNMTRVAYAHRSKRRDKKVATAFGVCPVALSLILGGCAGSMGTMRPGPSLPSDGAAAAAAAVPPDLMQPGQQAVPPQTTASPEYQPQLLTPPPPPTRRGSSTPPGSNMPGLATLPPPGPPQSINTSQPTPNPAGQVYWTPQGPAVTTGGTSGYQTSVTPGSGASGIIIPGAVNSTIMRSDGRVDVVPTPR